MKLSKIFILSAFVALGMSSCVSEDLSTSETKKGSGKLLIGVEMLAPTATRAETQAPDDFPLQIMEGETQIKKYSSWMDFPEAGLPMAPGTYTAISHSPGNIQKIMDAPYYMGTTTFEVFDQQNTEATVVCKMANGKITINLGNNFSSKFTTWTLTIDDGKNNALSFSNNTPSDELVCYWKFGENVSELRVNFTGKTSDGVDVKTTQILKKNLDETQSYPADSEYFQGGDCLVITMNPKPTTEGQIVGITLNVDISFANGNNDQDVTIDIFGEKQEDEPGGDATNHITVRKPDNMTITKSTDPDLGDTYIAATNGIKSIKVNIVTNSEDFQSSMEDLYDEYGVDFDKGAEVVGNQGIVDVLLSVGQNISVPTQGDTEYTFPIGKFFKLLSGMVGVHEFHLEITDMDGCCKAIGAIVLVVGDATVPATEPVRYTTTQTGGGSSSDAITLNLPSSMTITKSTDPTLGDTYIAAAKGIKSIMVNIVTNSEDFQSSMEDLYDEYGVDFDKGAEIVGNQGVVAVLLSVGQDISVPTQGDTEYTFPIGKFFKLLGGMPGAHTFNMTVTDMDGATKSGSLTLTVN